MAAHPVSYDLVQMIAMSTGFFFQERPCVGEMERVHAHRVLSPRVAQMQPMSAYRFHVLRPRIDEGHVLSRLRETSPDVSADRAGTDDRDVLAHVCQKT